MTILDPCPFCAAKDPVMEAAASGGFYVRCQCCSSEGPWANSDDSNCPAHLEELAATLWNIRTKPLTDADVQSAVEEARRIRPAIEAEGDPIKRMFVGEPIVEIEGDSIAQILAGEPVIETVPLSPEQQADVDAHMARREAIGR